ncbi:polysaccharide biosynthesis/export family protein [Roseivivax sediminis]|nr:polysaccharide biosynthesis/export family protein [Roseivivax sediminis]
MVLLVILVAIPGLAASQSEYRIQRGDTVTVEVLEDPSLNRSVTVLPDGRISFPWAGSVPAAGRTIAELGAAITSAIAPNFNEQPSVFVGVEPAPPAPPTPAPPPAPPEPDPVISIYIMGEVQASGEIEVAPGTTFLQALAQSGGLTPFAATKRVQLRRTDPLTFAQNVYTINYRALTRGAALQRDIALQEGDVILVPERGLFE